MDQILSSVKDALSYWQKKHERILDINIESLDLTQSIHTTSSGIGQSEIGLLPNLA